MAGADSFFRRDIIRSPGKAAGVLVYISIPSVMVVSPKQGK